MIMPMSRNWINRAGPRIDRLGTSASVIPRIL